MPVAGVFLITGLFRIELDTLTGILHRYARGSQFFSDEAAYKSVLMCDQRGCEFALGAEYTDD